MSRNILTTLDVAGGTDIGKKRQKNEDSFRLFVPPTDSAQEAQGALFIVADGMGGLGGGDIASQFAIDEFVRRYYGTMTTEKEVGARFQIALEAANVRVREQAPRLGLPRIGSTAAGLVLETSGRLMIFNVGDCRVYRIRHGRLERISKDQSITQQQIESGMITEEDAKVARSSMVTAFIGQPYPLVANTTFEQVQDGDVYLICSDGLWSLVDENKLLTTLRSQSAAGAIPKLVKMALDRGGVDNISAIVVRVGKPPAAGGFWLPAGVLGLLAAGALAAYSLLGAPAQATNLNGGSTATDSAATVPPPTVATTLVASPTDSVVSPSILTQPSDTSEPTKTAQSSPTVTSTATAASPSVSPTIRPTRTLFPSKTPTLTLTPSATWTASQTYTNTATYTITPSRTSSPTRTPTRTYTFTPSNTPTNTATFTLTFTPTETFTATYTPSNTPTPTRTRRPATRTPIPPTVAPTSPLPSPLPTAAPGGGGSGGGGQNGGGTSGG
jgi:PPM family protein phosphatase